MTAKLPGVSIIGGFILLPTGQTAISVRHLDLLRVTGKEDPDQPQARLALLEAFLSSGDGMTNFTLGRFRTFAEAQDALEDLLHAIERAAVTAEERIEVAAS